MPSSSEVADTSKGAIRQEVFVVDLDGTITTNDTLHELIVRLLFKKPLLIPGAIVALVRGRAAFKQYLAKYIPLDFRNLNYHQDLLDYLRSRKNENNHLVLCTASDVNVARSISNHLDLFNEVIASDGNINLKGAAKAELLKKRFPNGFVYVGDSISDLPVWKAADAAIVVGVSTKIKRLVCRQNTQILAEFNAYSNSQKSILKIWARGLRVHHWSKNLLLFVPLVLAHKWNDFELVIQACASFLLLLVTTSSTYLINDLSDLESDRLHPSKKLRPIASGALPISHAVIVAATALPTAITLAYLLKIEFFLSLLIYLVITLSYSYGLKRIPLFDILLISVLFTSRIVMGSVLLEQPMPAWLLTFSMFLFFSLAAAKRHVEIIRTDAEGENNIISRGYKQDDAILTLCMGTAAGLASILIMVLYLVEEAFTTVAYDSPKFLWLAVLCLAIWVGRIWLLTHRGEMHDDPVSFALGDRASIILAIIVIAAFVLAL